MDTPPRAIIGVILALAVSGCTPTPKEPATTEAAPSVAPVGCRPMTDDKAWYASGQKALLFKDLGELHYPITTRSKEAQRYFDQGLLLSYGFNHAEAARSFWQAAREDSACAMAWWGFAYVLGPNYNAGMEPDSYERAHAAIQKAKALSANANGKERGLIDAMALRYTATAPEDRGSLDRAYSDALRALTKKYPDDADIAAMFAESLMDQHPWDLYEHDGTPKVWTPEIIAALERSMKTWPDHPGAHHFYIHAVEASKDPDRGLASARLFHDRVPGSGHLVHMPSHIFMRTGHFHEGVLANQRSIAVDSNYIAACHAQGMYPIGYFPHNIHFLAACAALAGESELAWESARLLRAKTANALLKEAGWETLQHFWAYPLFVAVKLGMWDKVRAEAAPDSMPYPLALWNYAQGMADLHEGDIATAKRRLLEVQRIEGDSTVGTLKIWGINSALTIMEIADNVLDGEIHAAEGDLQGAIVLLKEAVALEDGLNYQEPPDWSFPSRHDLGAIQVAAGQFDDAIATYEQDLAMFRENGWALIGLLRALEGAKRTAEANAVQERFTKAWQHADLTITSSRIL